MAVQPLSPVPGPPDLAGAYGRGGALALQRQQLEQQAIESERNAQIQRQQIAAQQQIANQRAMQAQTQAAIENQMNQARLGLAEREMAAQEAEFERRSQEAARTFQARQKYQALVEDGMDPREAMMRLLPELDMPAGAYRAADQGEPLGPPPSELNIVRDPETGERVGTTFPTGPRSQQFIPDNTTTTSVTDRAIWSQRLRGLRDEVSDLEDRRDVDAAAVIAASIPEADRSKKQREAAKRYEDWNKQIDAKKKEIQREVETLDKKPQTQRRAPDSFPQQGFNTPEGLRMIPGAVVTGGTTPGQVVFGGMEEETTEGGAGIKILNIRRKGMSDEQRRALQSF